MHSNVSMHAQRSNHAGSRTGRRPIGGSAAKLDASSTGMARGCDLRAAGLFCHISAVTAADSSSCAGVRNGLGPVEDEFVEFVDKYQPE